MDWLNIIHRETAQVPTDNFRPGDEVRVWYKLYEQDKERTAQFEGIVIRSRGAQGSKTFTVRRVTYGEGVERSFPLNPKIVSKVEVIHRGQVKRGRLYFLRSIIGKTRIASASQQTEAKAQAANAAQAQVSQVVEEVVAAAGKSAGAKTGD